jgi:hypothetical protein
LQEQAVAITINENSVTALSAGAKIRRQPLLSARHTKDSKILHDRVTVDAGGVYAFDIAPTDLAWLQILEGEVQLTHTIHTPLVKPISFSCHLLSAVN